MAQKGTNSPDLIRHAAAEDFRPRTTTPWTHNSRPEAKTSSRTMLDVDLIV